jgi:hypothetical protein
MKRLRGGPLLDLLIKNMLAKTGALHSAPEEFKRMVKLLKHGADKDLSEMTFIPLN